ncbi:exopolysaccharide biosynthesis protein [Loigolactobacillus coryniformis subsp. coryniformis]|uniref:Glycosyltransferase n=1 Tax=Loigolactobacillus coryniformis subsp. coryniformis KCTC 3167 = DSM 20001 TaxID=913848 RepID=A0A0R1F5N0_9LACO|nr:DUF4422 domain-containing protein [Loigolactobacillus coryniformis]ATO55116.1 exopolysaccharide biosynthesis protein [Loigolactobacillus coryniformis subsp. coryniformis KCTC 3167 = DSM 20001]KRK15587.1 glycosyltransferase [Loigolactobacillus coryniformis subsp. coryniformis KCTC 3167 = DSM 20001]OEH89208.1 exopolysaccharide biosynthesis protein [Loigolactobacillus coryniformis subsp. coryniformis]
MNIKILVAAHKNYVMPQDQNLYLPIFVGKDLHPDVNHTFQGDNTGDNISVKNAHYNELTAIYWAWRNLDADAIGLVHYRRYLSLHKQKDLTSVLDQAQAESLLQDHDIILPKKRNYYIESNYSHYVHAHHAEPLDLTRKIIEQDYSMYLNAFDEVMQRKSAHMFNMFIMKQQPFDEYCQWLFDILAKVEQNLDISDYNQYEARVYGFISERLLDVWLAVNEQYRTTEVNFVYMEKQNWLVKGGNFLKRMVKPNY